MFTYKTQEEVDKMTASEYETYTTEKSAHEADLRKQEIEKAIEEAQKNNATKEEVEALTNKNADIVKEIERLSLDAKKRSEQPNGVLKNFATALMDAFKSMGNSIEDVIEKKVDATKAVVNITDATTIDAVGSASHYSLTTPTGFVGTIRSRMLTYLQNVSVRNIGGNRAMWFVELDEQGTPIMIAEAATKTKVSVRYEEREKKSKKIGIHSKVSTEFLRNLPQLVSYVQSNLIKRLEIATENQLFGGDDTGNNLAGLSEYAVAFTGGSLAGTLPNPSINDVFRAVVLQVTEAYHMPNAIFVRPGVIAQMDVAKSADGIYELPPFRQANGNVVSGMTLIETMGLPSGIDFMGGDLSVVQVAFTSPLSVEINRSGTDMIDNLRTILVEQELVQWVSETDVNGLVYGDVATAITALTEE
jgi:hypothetical protein